jgi:hypothetical protein
VTTDPYLQMAGHLPNEIAIGGALITMVEPDVGFEHAYNRWYEDDHFYSGATVGPWMFAARRWVATRDLQQLRFPADSPIADPVTTGCYISTYWMLAGHYDDAVRWGTNAMRDHLYPYGRGFDQRQHVYTAFSMYDFGVVRTDLVHMQPHHTLDHPFDGMVVEVIEPAPGVERAALVARLRDELVPSELAGSPAAAALGFMPEPIPDGGNVPRVASAVGAGRNVTLLWFLQVDPRACWSMFQRHTDRVAQIGGRLVFAAPFVPTVPGTDTYVSELR